MSQIPTYDQLCEKCLSPVREPDSPQLDHSGKHRRSDNLAAAAVPDRSPGPETDLTNNWFRTDQCDRRSKHRPRDDPPTTAAVPGRSPRQAADLATDWSWFGPNEPDRAPLRNVEALMSAPGRAVAAPGLTVGGGTRCTGEVRSPGAHSKSQLVCPEVVFSNPNGRAVAAPGLTVGGGTRCTGEVRSPGAHSKSIGYGYRPVLALIPWILLLGVGSVLFQVVSHDLTLLHPAKLGPEQPSFNTFRYTVDLLLPVANLGLRESFVAGGWVAWVSFGVYLCRLAAGRDRGRRGLTGVFKRD